MDDRHFDELTKALVGGMDSRRAALRLLASSALGVLAARFGGPEIAEAEQKGKNNKDKNGKKKRKKKDKKKDKKPTDPPQDPPSDTCTANSDCGACQVCVGGRCEDGVPPLCDPQRCEVIACAADTNRYECVFKCNEGELCCNGRCELPCNNGCDLDPNQACLCEKPREGEVYCAVFNNCGVWTPPCPEHAPTWDSATCRCLCAEGETCFAHGSSTVDCCTDDSFCCGGFVSCCPNEQRRTLPNGRPCCLHPVRGDCTECLVG